MKKVKKKEVGRGKNGNGGGMTKVTTVPATVVKFGTRKSLHLLSFPY